MTHLQIATLYIGLNVLLLAVLKMNVGRARAQQKVNFGDGGNDVVLPGLDSRRITAAGDKSSFSVVDCESGRILAVLYQGPWRTQFVR